MFKYRTIMEKYRFTNVMEDEDLFHEMASEIKASKQKICPKLVPLTYAKNKIGKVHNFVKSSDDDEDSKVFINRFNEIENMPEGHQFTVEKFREPGFHGQEYREVLNYCICKGILEKEFVFDSEGKVKLHKFIRIKGEECHNFNKCENCKLYERCKAESKEFTEYAQYIEKKE